MFKTILPCLWPQFQEPTDVCQNAAQPLITFTGSGGTAPYTFTILLMAGLHYLSVQPQQPHR
jgi:hypothetical protein